MKRRSTKRSERPLVERGKQYTRRLNDEELRRWKETLERIATGDRRHQYQGTL